MIKLHTCQIHKGEDFHLNLKDITFHKGHNYFIVGASGSGKSTFIRALLGLEVFQGNIDKTEESNTINSTHPSYKKGLMYLSQEFALWDHLTVEEHLNFTLSQGKSLAIHPETNYYLTLVNLTKHTTSKPIILSGGEKQRLALARALATKPKYLFLDEPFANIDMVQANLFMKMLKIEQKKQHFTLINVTHHFVGIKEDDSIIIVLEEGKMTFQGTYLQLSAQTLSPWIEQWKALLP